MDTEFMQAFLAQPRGFCAGVERAIRIVEGALKLYGAPIYVRHEIVHNRRVVDELRAQGAIFVDELTDIPSGSVTIFSAHGVSAEVEKEAMLRGLSIIDATCPLVEKVHKEAQKFSRSGRKIILIGHRGHPEVAGTSGRVEGGVILVSSVEEVASLVLEESDSFAYVTQTTLSIDDTRDIISALHRRFRNIIGPDLRDICYATQNRQNAVRVLAQQCDLVLVVGDNTSSNSNRLRDIGIDMCVPTHLIDDATCIDPAWLKGVAIVGITAGASAPEKLVQEVVVHLRQMTTVKVHTLGGVVERVEFKLPPELSDL
jgi:4-hydroxy-3-methylbut-2-enyl diphosphate reductase